MASLFTSFTGISQMPRLLSEPIIYAKGAKVAIEIRKSKQGKL